MPRVFNALSGIALARSVVAIIAAIACFALSTPALADSHGGALATQQHSLAGQWKFRTDPYKKGDAEDWWAPALDDAHWDQIAVPALWDTYDIYSDYTGTAWYRLDFASDPAWAGQRARLVFDSVYYDAEVWLNGKRLGENGIGFLSFDFEVADTLKPAGMNTLVVKVDNQFKRGAVWNWGGIRRPVYLEFTPAARLEKVYVDAFPDLAAGSADVRVRTRLSSSEAMRGEGAVNVRILREGREIARQSAPLPATVPAGEDTNVRLQFALAAGDVDLWHFNDPNLYDIEATLSWGGTATHAITDHFGIRKLEAQGDKLLLNGEPIKVMGFNTVPEDRFTANALPLSRIKEDVDLLKMLNTNFARLSGQPLPKPYLDYLDEVGFMTFEEVGVWGKDKLVHPEAEMPKEWLRRMIDERHNHPSIIGWSVGNEIGYFEKNPLVGEYVQSMIELTRELDPTRLAVYVSNSVWAQPDDPAQYADMVLFNKYNDHVKLVQKVREYQPGKPIFWSEIGKTLDDEDPNLSYVDPEQLIGPQRQFPWLTGASLWTFNDYRSNWQSTSEGWSTAASENRSWGVVTIYRDKKRSYYRFRDFNAPVEVFDFDGSTLSLTTRGAESFPSFTLRDYRVAWVARDEAGAPVAAGSELLPELAPGAGVSDIAVNPPAGAAVVDVHLLDPRGYSVRNERREMIAPAAPQVRAMHSATRELRVVYDRVANADHYIATAIAPDGKRIASEPSINDWIEITELEPETEYHLAVQAVNDAGASDMEATRALISTDPDELPPVIWATKGEEDAFFIGFSSDITDFRYEVAYGLEPGEYTRQFLIQTRGSTRIPAIEPGARHCFTFRRHVTGSVASEWTDEHCLDLASEKGLPAPANAFALRDGDALVLGLDPVAGATGYRLTSGDRSVDAKLAQSPFIVLEDIALTSDNIWQIATLDEQGRAGSATTITYLGE